MSPQSRPPERSDNVDLTVRVAELEAALKVTEDEAFKVLSRISMDKNQKVRQLADDIVLTGTF